MINYMLMGQYHKVPMQFVYTLGHNPQRNEIVKSIFMLNPALVFENPALAILLRSYL